MGIWRNKDLQRAWQRKRYAERRVFILEYKKEYNGCKKCGWNKRYEVLEFHHINKKRKKFNINGNYIANCSMERLKKEILKCDLLCPNCHAIFHYNEKDWFKELGKRNKKKERIYILSSNTLILNKKIKKLVSNGIKRGMTGYKISKKYKLNKQTVYNHINKIKKHKSKPPYNARLV